MRLLLLAGLVLVAPAVRAQSTCTPEHAAMGHCTMPAAPAPSAQPTAATTTATTAHPADATFMQMMIPHHEQALEMTALVPDRTDNHGFRMLAERMETAQRDEIRWMRHWLEQRGQDPAAHAGHLMEGMLTPEQMADLAGKRGDAFVYTFCAYMIQHHEGALTMARDLFASYGAAQTADVHKLATDIEADQKMDIVRMRGLMATLAPVPLVPVTPPSSSGPSGH